MSQVHRFTAIIIIIIIIIIALQYRMQDTVESSSEHGTSKGSVLMD